MDYISIILIAIALSMDAFAVSVSRGIVIDKCKIKHAFTLAILFGAFQALMPVVGWFLGHIFKEYVSSYDHWIAFILLLLVGARMIYEAVKPNEENNIKCDISFQILLMLAVATSIDALAVGVTFSFLNISIVIPIIIIGIITFINSFVGVIVGSSIGKIFGKKVEILGGVILVGMGFKILLEHLIRG